MALSPMTNSLLPAVEQGSVHLFVVDDKIPHDEMTGSSVEKKADGVVRFDSQTRQDEATVGGMTGKGPAAVHTQSTFQNHEQDNDILVVAKENHEPSDAKGKIVTINKSVTNTKVSLHAAAPQSQQQISSSPFPSPSRLGYTDSHPSERSAYAMNASTSASHTSNEAALYHPQVLDPGSVEDTISLVKKDGMSVDEDYVSQLPKQVPHKTNVASLKIAQTEVSRTEDGSPPEQKRVRWTKEEDDVLLKAVSVCTLRNRNKPVIEWKPLVQGHLQGIRSESSCKTRYYRLTKSGLNQAPLTTDENQTINQEQGLEDSNVGARASNSLGSSVSEMRNDFDDGPTVHQQRKGQLWTEEEDSMLLKAVNKSSNRLGFKPDTINWPRLARTHFRGKRSARQCQRRYERYVKPRLKHGPFTEEEDRIIFEGAAENKTWNEIAILLGGTRHQEIIQARWTIHLDPELKREPFTDEEKEILTQAHERLGNKWTKISELLPGRTLYQVRDAWLSMKSAKSKQITSQE